MTETSARRQPKHHNKLLVLIAVIQERPGAALRCRRLRRHAPAPQRRGRRLRSGSRSSPLQSRIALDQLHPRQSSLINDPLLRRIGALAFSYAGLSLAEGIGLYLEKAWGEVAHPRHHRLVSALGDLRGLPPPHLGPRRPARRQYAGLYLSVEARRQPQEARRGSRASRHPIAVDFAFCSPINLPVRSEKCPFCPGTIIGKHYILWF